jgi:hypothetical protein
MDRLTALTITTALALAIAIAGAAVGVYAATRVLPSPRAIPQRIESDIASLQSGLKASEAAAAAEHAEAHVQDGKLGKLLACVPELMNYINGLTPEVVAGNVSLSPHEQISTYCSGVFYPTG